MRKIIVLFLLIILSCNESSKSAKQQSSGALNEVLILCENDIWNDKSGVILSKILTKKQTTLPQPEPLFRISHVNNLNFKNILKPTRNIIFVDYKNTESKITIKRNVFSEPQIFVKIIGKKEKLPEFIKKNKKYIIDIVKNSDIKFLLSRLNKNKNDTLDLLKNQKIHITIPKDYFKAEALDTFFWYRKTALRGLMNVLIYSSPIPKDNNITKELLIKNRDKLAKIHVSGSQKDSFMQTEKRYDITQLKIIKNQKYLEYKMRGLWKMENDFMGGPFVSRSIIDTKNNRILTAEGFLFAPNQKKTNMLFELEAIISSLKIK